RPDHAVIKNLSLSIRSGEKIGVSTLATAFFRMMELSNGTIVLDGRDISQLGLKTLRSSIQIIPQDPILFQGTIRSNLDPTGHYSCEEIWRAVELAGLQSYIGGLQQKLDSAVSSNGSNFSVGQRQLLCLARAILVAPAVLIMDEATAAVDEEADQLIQHAIALQFTATTVISIAHRLQTVASFDRVLVLDNGSLVEYDSPANLLQNAESAFSALVEASGSSNAQRIRSIASKHSSVKL
ncbi:hypothetical protein HDU91_006826, partial [Kappamyces sp. JEL0680]